MTPSASSSHQCHHHHTTLSVTLPLVKLSLLLFLLSALASHLFTPNLSSPLLIVSAAPVETEYYKVLGVKPTASEQQIKRAYHKKALKLHPDKNPDDPQAEEKFLKVSHAYEVLGDPEKRKVYDSQGSIAFESGSGTPSATPNQQQQQQYQQSNPFGGFGFEAGGGAGGGGGYTQQQSADGRTTYTYYSSGSSGAGMGGAGGGYQFKNPNDVFTEFFGSNDPFGNMFNMGRGGGRQQRTASSQSQPHQQAFASMFQNQPPPQQQQQRGSKPHSQQQRQQQKSQQQQQSTPAKQPPTFKPTGAVTMLDSSEVLDYIMKHDTMAYIFVPHNSVATTQLKKLATTLHEKHTAGTQQHQHFYLLSSDARNTQNDVYKKLLKWIPDVQSKSASMLIALRPHKQKYAVHTIADLSTAASSASSSNTSNASIHSFLDKINDGAVTWKLSKKMPKTAAS